PRRPWSPPYGARPCSAAGRARGRWAGAAGRRPQLRASTPRMQRSPGPRGHARNRALGPRGLRGHVGAAPEAGRVVVVPGRVRHRAVLATVAVEVRVLVVAAQEGALGIIHPLVDVADHVVDAVAVHAAAELARLRERPGKLVKLRVVHLRPG